MLGQYFITALYDAIGQDAYRGALRELYERYVRYEPPPTEEQVYQAFLKHTPPDREPALIDVYRRLHGAPFVG